MIDFDYGFHHIERVWKIVRGQEEALNDMDISSDGFWRSFAAIIWALPALFFAWVIDARDLIIDGVDYSMVQIVLFSAIIEMVLWFLPILILAFALKPLGFAQRFSHLIIARNWLSVPIVYAYVLIMLVRLFFGDVELLVFLILIVLIGAIWMQIRVTRVSLDATASMAAGLVIAEFLLLIITMYYLQSAFGLITE